MFECIDFDEHLASFVTEYMQAHQKDYKNYDAMEADMPAIYVRFLNQPADWLDGLTPGSYFTQFEDPKDLVDWMIAYDQKGVAIPDLLLEQIENVGKPCEKRLVAILKDEEMSDALKMTAIGVLRTMESTQPKMLYIQWQMEREREDELADNALESLADMGRAALQPILEALPKANEAGQGSRAAGSMVSPSCIVSRCKCAPRQASAGASPSWPSASSAPTRTAVLCLPAIWASWGTTVR